MKSGCTHSLRLNQEYFVRREHAGCSVTTSRRLHAQAFLGFGQAMRIPVMRDERSTLVKAAKVLFGSNSWLRLAVRDPRATIDGLGRA